MSVIMRAPTGAGISSKVFFADGTSSFVDANGNLTVDGKYINELETAGYVKYQLPEAKYTANTATTATTATAASFSGAKHVTLNMTGILAAGRALTTPSAADIVAQIPDAAAGDTYILRIENNSSGDYAWTVTAGSGITVTGTATIAMATWREYLVTLTSLTAVVLQNIGSGVAN